MSSQNLEAWVEQAADETALTEPQAEAFYRRRVLGQSRKDVAAAMDVSKANVEQRDGDARRKIVQAHKLERLAEQVGWEPDPDQTPPGGGGVSIREFAGRIAALFTPEEIDPDTATLEEIADYCGIENPETVPDVVPVEQYRENGGVVRCGVSNREPFPPETIVANFPLPEGGREVLSGQVYADILADTYGLTDEEAEVLTYARAGWSANEIYAVASAHKPGDVLQSAREKVRAQDE